MIRGFVIALSFVVAITLAFPLSDEIVHLPGLTSTPLFKQYSGYLNATGTRKLHYWLVLSQNDPVNDPVVLWLNGGPGCSSMEGILNENGPFLVNPDGKTLSVNAHSWNKVANVLYIESPVGVGYSYSQEQSIKYDDDMAAEDNYRALKSFFSLFDALKKNEFFITGESYAGIYVPTLAMKVMDDAEINLKGTATGNGFNNAGMNENSLLYFGFYHGLIDHRTFSRMVESCQCNGTAATWCDFLSQSARIKDCAAIVNSVTSNKIYNSGINVYNMYQDCVYPSSQQSRWVSVFKDQRLLYTRVREESVKYISKKGYTLTPACVDAHAILDYMNLPAVKQALHIPNGLPAWDICSDKVTMSYNRLYTSMADQYHKLLKAKKYSLMIYNGDVDMACNFLGDQWFVDSLGQQALSDFKPWYVQKDDGKQIAGFVKKYDGITFITIKGAGHMVPQDKPVEALEMFTNFLHGNL